MRSHAFRRPARKTTGGPVGSRKSVAPECSHETPDVPFGANAAPVPAAPPAPPRAQVGTGQGVGRRPAPRAGGEVSTTANGASGRGILMIRSVNAPHASAHPLPLVGSIRRRKVAGGGRG